MIGASALSQPTGVAVDASGNIYVADAGNHVVIAQNSAGGFMSAYPNPYTLNSTIAVNLPQSDDITLEVYNVLGVKSHSTSIIGSQPLSIDLSNQPTGVYFLKIIYPDGSSTVKKIIRD